MDPLKESIAVLIRSASDPSRILLVRRPSTDPEFPGMWGLPAVTLRAGESDREALERLARQKLGSMLSALRLCCTGEQQRQHYRLRMRLYEARLCQAEPSLPAPGSVPDVTLYEAWRWGRLSELAVSAEAGSLCSLLALQCNAR